VCLRISIVSDFTTPNRDLTIHSAIGDYLKHWLFVCRMSSSPSTVEGLVCSTFFKVCTNLSCSVEFSCVLILNTLQQHVTCS
jgi:hypothetical protein